MTNSLNDPNVKKQITTGEIKMKTLLTILLTLLALSANAKEASQPQMEVRCYTWASLSDMDKGIKTRHLDLAKATLNTEDLMFEAGYAEGLIAGLSAMNNTTKKKAAYEMYVSLCLESI